VLSADSPFAGPPSPKIDKAWTQLLEHVNIRASKSELASSNQTSVPLTDESGFLVWMEVSHQLHCVVRYATFTLTLGLIQSRIEIS
jgi:hypothetical protein